MAEEETKSPEKSHKSELSVSIIQNTLKRMGSVSISYSVNWDNIDFLDQDESWIQLKDVPFRSHFVAFRGTILAITYKSQAKHYGYWGDAIYIYNVESDTWDKYAKYPNDFDSTNISVALNDYTKTLYGYAYENNAQINTLKVIDLRNKTFQTQKVVTDALSLTFISTVFINDTYHVFGGEQEQCHLILSKQFELKQCCKSIPLQANYHGTRPWALMYAMNKRMIILAGDYDTWMKKVPLYCYEMDGNPFKPQWTKVFIELPNQEIHHETIEVRALSYCYHEKSENILIFDGLRGKGIYVVNINDFRVKESQTLCPENKVYDVVFVSHMCENEKMVTGYARENGINQLPNDIMNEIAHWMEGFDCVHLFDKNRGLCHWVIDVDSIINNVY